MSFQRILIPGFILLLCSCAGNEHKTIAGLTDQEINVTDVKIEGGIEKAMRSYQQFLEQTPETAMTPEAIRRLADLNIEQEYGALSQSDVDKLSETGSSETIVKSDNAIKAASPPVTVPNATVLPGVIASVEDQQNKLSNDQKSGLVAAGVEKTTAAEVLLPVALMPDGTNLEDLQTAGAKKAIALYLKLLKKFPDYERNDQVLYQLSRAYEETGQVEEAMKVMNQLIIKYPASRHFAEVQFRRGEYFFTRKKWLDAEDAYKSLLDAGKGTGYYDLALYKRGWTFYKQELYEEGLQHFIGLLDYKISIGYDFEQTENDAEKKRIEDNYRVISLSFSNLGGADAVIDFFNKNGTRTFESEVYSHLAEFYLTKRRYSDAAKTYNTYIERNPFNKKSPYFSMRVIDIYQQGGFPKLVIDAKKDYASTYGLKADFWKYFNPAQFVDVVDFLKKNIIDLANFYHALYQDKRFKNKKKDSFTEAAHWYKEFLVSFPKDQLSAGINYQLADLYLENNDLLLAAVEYEKTAYEYPKNAKSSSAGYAAVATYRDYLNKADQYDKNRVKREVIRVSLRFVDVYPEHEKAAIILSAAADDLYDLKDFQLAINASQQLIKNYQQAEMSLIRSAWLVIAYGSFDLLKYKDAELAFIQVLAIKDKNQKKRKELQENLAAAIYKQGEQSVKLLDHRSAVAHFLRVGELVPHSVIRSTAEYDAATALIQLKDWPQALKVLNQFRQLYPSHKLQSDITKKLAYVYKENKNFDKAAIEFEKIAAESNDLAIRRESLLIAAELYEQVSDKDNELRVYKQFVSYFQKPVEELLEINTKIAAIYKVKNDEKNYTKTLRSIIKTEASAGKERTERTRYLAAMASLAVIDPLYTEFAALKLVKPFKKNLKKKQDQMKANIKKYNKLVDYRVGDVTAAATYYIAETYYEFSRSLMKSERPSKLSDLELEQYNELIEEQAYPFEEKGINIHKKNIELLSVGVYSQWIDKSLKKLAERLPGRYAKDEVSTGALDSLMFYRYEVSVPVSTQSASPSEPEKTLPVKAASSDTQGEPGQDKAQSDQSAVSALPGGVN